VAAGGGRSERGHQVHRRDKLRAARGRGGSVRAAQEASKRAATIEQDLRARLAHNVQRLRLARELTTEQAAEAAHISRSHWEKVEAGEANATLTTLERIASALSVRAADLFVRPSRKGGR